MHLFCLHYELYISYTTYIIYYKTYFIIFFFQSIFATFYCFSNISNAHRQINLKTKPIYQLFDLPYSKNSILIFLKKNKY